MKLAFALLGFVDLACASAQSRCIKGFPAFDDLRSDTITIEHLLVLDSCNNEVLFDWSPLAGLLRIESIGPEEARLTGAVAVPLPGQEMYQRIEALQWTVVVDSSTLTISRPVVLDKAIVNGAYLKKAHALFSRMKRNGKYRDEDVSRLSMAEWDQLRDLSYMLMFCSINGDNKAQDRMRLMRTLFPGLRLGILSEEHRGNEILSEYFSR